MRMYRLSTVSTSIKFQLQLHHYTRRILKMFWCCCCCCQGKNKYCILVPGLPVFFKFKSGGTFLVKRWLGKWSSQPPCRKRPINENPGGHNRITSIPAKQFEANLTPKKFDYQLENILFLLLLLSLLQMLPLLVLLLLLWMLLL